MKIVCSTGPNIKTTEDLEKLISAGGNIIRFNFSHINYSQCETFIKYLEDKHPNVLKLQDLQGNKVRISKLFKEEIKTKIGDVICFCSEEFFKKKNNIGEKKIPISFNGKFQLLENVNRIMMKDGTMEFKILEKKLSSEYIITEVVKGGIIRAEKGVNLPGMDREGTSITQKDIDDITWGVKNSVDIICLSYVVDGSDILSLRRIVESSLKKINSSKVPLIYGKIECLEGAQNLKEILPHVDGIIVGRGDILGEVDINYVPVIQEQIINQCRDFSKPVIVSTYLLESMKKNITPCISEVNELYNLIKIPVDGFMLCGEVTVGRYPNETVKFLKEFIDRHKEIE